MTDIILYPCNPNKNVACNKRGCFINGGPCQETRHIEYADVRSVAFPKELFQEQHEWVQVVRCKDCKDLEQFEHDGVLEYWCDIVDGVVTLDDYCSWGEPKEDNDGD